MDGGHMQQPPLSPDQLDSPPLHLLPPSLLPPSLDGGPPTAHAVPPPIPPHPFSQSVNSLLSLCHSHPPPISSPPRTTDPTTHLFKAPIFSRKCDIGIQAIRKAKRAYETLEKKQKERTYGSLRAFENLGKKWNCKREEGSEKMDMLLTAANTLNYEEKLATVQTDLQKG